MLSNGLPTVSVLLAVRNGERTIAEAVESVFSQTALDTIEVIIIDDGSTDRTRNILERIPCQNASFILLQNKFCQGLTKSLNQALSKARGRYIARIDHDDVWHPEKISQQLSYVENHPEVGILGTAYFDMDEDGGNMRAPEIPICYTDLEIRKALYKANPFFHSSILARTDLVRSIGGYDESFLVAQDYDLWVRLLGLTKGAILPEVLCYRRIGRGNISVKKERRQRINALRAKARWVKENGMDVTMIVPAMRDLAIIALPAYMKKIVRKRLHEVKHRNAGS